MPWRPVSDRARVSQKRRADDRVAASVLGKVERAICTLHEILTPGIAGIGYERSDTGADGDDVARTFLVPNRQGKDRLANLVSDRGGSGLVGCRQQHGEFLAAVSGSEVARPSQRV